MSETLRFGMVGAGMISAYHIESLQATPAVEVVAVCDQIPEAASKRAETSGVGKSYSDLGEMISKESLDAIAIGTPSGAHHEVAMPALEAGLHVICEKPLDVTGPKMTEMIEKARAMDLRLGVCYQMRFNPVYDAAKKAVDAGALGDLYIAEITVTYFRDIAYYESGAWRGTIALDGGGATMNQGSHGVDLFHWLVGDVEEVCAVSRTAARPIEVEDVNHALLKLKCGAQGTLSATTLSYPGWGTRINLYGSKGTICVEEGAIKEWTFIEDGPPRPEVAAWASGAGKATGIDTTGHKILMKDFAEAIREGRDPAIPGHDARKSVDIILATYESSRQGGKWIRV